MSILWCILIGIAAGWLAGQIMKGGGYGLIGDLVLGLIGGLIGGWVFGEFGVVGIGLLGQLVVATVGAIILVAIVRLIKRGP